LKKYLSKLFENATEESKIFWATYSIFVVKRDAIYLCSNMGTYCPLYDVDVRKSNSTHIEVEPYKIDGYKKYTINHLSETLDELKNTVSLCDVLGIKKDFDQHWEGTVTVRSNFTGWNKIDVYVDRMSIFSSDEFEYD
jgi:hypothetical protein